MNKKIDEFAKQCVDTVWVDMCDDADYVFNKEKFALLIIRECARIITEKQTENDLKNIVSENPARDFCHALIKEFGIK